MEYVYAAMLLHSAKKEVTEANVEAIIKAAGLDVDKTKAKSLIEALKDVNIDDVIKQASMVQVAAPASAAPAAKVEEEKPKGKTEEEAAAGLGSLFG